MSPEQQDNPNLLSPANQPQSHAPTSTTLIIAGKPHFSPQQGPTPAVDMSMVQRESSSYLDNMFTGANHHRVHIDESNNVISPDEDDNDKLENDKKRASIINDLVVDPAILSPSDGGTPSHHKKTSSTIQGGFHKFQQQLSEKIVSSLADAAEHREKISETLQQIMDDVQQQKQQNVKKDDKGMRKAIEGINSMRSDVNRIGNKLKEYHNKTIKEIQTMTERITNSKDSTPTPRKSTAARTSKNKINANDDWDRKPRISSPQDVFDGDEWDKEWDKSQRENYKKKIAELQRKIERLKDDVKSKENLIQSQAMNIKQLQMNSIQNESFDSMKNEILQQMKSQFQSLQHQQYRSRKDSLFDDVKKTLLLYC